MADIFEPLPVASPYVTAEYQLAQARALAAAQQVNREAYLREIAQSNEQVNSDALVAPAFSDNPLLELQPADSDGEINTASLLSVFSKAREQDESSPPPIDYLLLKKDIELVERAEANGTEESAAPSQEPPLFSARRAEELAQATRQLAENISNVARQEPGGRHVNIDPAALSQALQQLAFVLSFVAGMQNNPHFAPFLGYYAPKPKDKVTALPPVFSIDAEHTRIRA